jgi:hypothetical protein
MDIVGKGGGAAAGRGMGHEITPPRDSGKPWGNKIILSGRQRGDSFHLMIAVECVCGKKFRTSDDNAGKRTRCKGCGAVLTIPQAAVVATASAAPVEEDSDSLSGLAAVAGGAEVFQPATVGSVPRAGSPQRSTSAATKAPVFPGVPTPKSGRDARTGGGVIAPNISVSPMVVILVALAIIIPATIYWAEHGPMEAGRQWKQISGVAEDNIVQQTTRAIQNEYQDSLTDAFAGMHVHPKASSMFFDEPAIMWRLPETIRFQVASSEGPFHGDFHPRTYQFEMTGEIAGKSHTITGSASETDQSLTMDGKKIN